MTDTLPRERLNILLDELASMLRIAPISEQFAKTVLEILRLAVSGADLRDNWKPPTPIRARKQLGRTPADIAEAKNRLAELRRERARITALRENPFAHKGLIEDALAPIYNEIALLERHIGAV